MLGRVEDVGDKVGRFDADGPAELHTLLESTENGRGKDVLSTFLPGGDGTTRLALCAEDQPNEHVHASEGEEEEGGHEGEAADMVRKNCSPNQTLDDAESTDAKVVSKDGEEPIEEGRGPADFGKEEDDDLSNDQKTVENGPEDTGRLVGNGRIRNIIVADGRRVTRGDPSRVTWTVLVRVESLDVVDEGHDAAREYENEGDDAQSSDDIQPNENISSRW